VVSLNSPNAEFPSLLMNYNCYIIPHGSASTIGKTGIGTGPFKLKSFQPAATGVVEANPDYHEGRPNLDSITFIAISDVQARVNALLAGQVDLISQTNLDFATARVVQANPSTTIVPDKNAYWYTMPMLATKAPFTDLRVREAFKLAYDPRSLLQLTLQGHGAAAHNNPVPPTEPDWLPVSQEQDIGKAKLLLKAAGFPNGITIQLYTSSYDANLTPLALAYKNSVAAAGINVQVVQAPSDSYYTKVWITKPFCVSYWYTGRPIDQLLNQIFRGGSSYNESLWTNSQFDQLLDAARRQVDNTKRKHLYQEAQSILVQQCGDMVPLFADRLTGVSRKVQNYHEHGFEFDYKNLALAT
jgi:peptide/nickel transport system substrate-binding protein